MNKHKKLHIVNIPSEELLKLLDKNIIGTPGQGMLYQHLGVRDKIHQISNPYFINLVRNENIVGTCCFCRRFTWNVGVMASSFYVRYFSFENSYRRKKTTVTKFQKQSQIRLEIHQILNGSGLDVRADEKIFHYAYVDPRNVRSKILCTEFGFEPVRKFSTIIFNRLLPKCSLELEEATEQIEIKQMLRSTYSNFTMFSEENLFNGRKYYVIRNEVGEIIAGAQVNLDTWNIISLPHFSGNVLLNTLTYLPFLNRLFNKKYRFLAVDGLYFKKGYEQKLVVLLESLLAKYNVFSAMLMTDVESDIYNVLKTLNLGWIDKLNKEVHGEVICRFSNYTDQEKLTFKRIPAYISGIDVT